LGVFFLLVEFLRFRNCFWWGFCNFILRLFAEQKHKHKLFFQTAAIPFFYSCTGFVKNKIKTKDFQKIRVITAKLV